MRPGGRDAGITFGVSGESAEGWCRHRARRTWFRRRDASDGSRRAVGAAGGPEIDMTSAWSSAPWTPEGDEMDQETRSRELVAGLRQLADLIEQYPGVAHGSPCVLFEATTPAEAAQLLAGLGVEDMVVRSSLTTGDGQHQVAVHRHLGAAGVLASVWMPDQVLAELTTGPVRPTPEGVAA